MTLKFYIKTVMKNKIMVYAFAAFLFLSVLVIIRNNNLGTILPEYDIFRHVYSIYFTHFLVVPVYIFFVLSNNTMFFSSISLIRYKTPYNALMQRIMFLLTETLCFTGIFYLSGLVSIVIMDVNAFTKLPYVLWIMEFLIQYASLLFIGATLLCIKNLTGNSLAAGIITFIVLSIDFIFVATGFWIDYSVLYLYISSMKRYVFWGIGISDIIISLWRFMLLSIVFMALSFLIYYIRIKRRKPYDWRAEDSLN